MTKVWPVIYDQTVQPTFLKYLHADEMKALRLVQVHDFGTKSPNKQSSFQGWRMCMLLVLSYLQFFEFLA